MVAKLLPCRTPAGQESCTGIPLGELPYLTLLAVEYEGLRLSEQLRATALKNLGRPAEMHHSAISGRFVASSYAKRHLGTAVMETASSSSTGANDKTSRSSSLGWFLRKSRKS